MRDTPAEVPAIFHSLPARLRPERVEGFTGSYHFDIRGAAEPHWTVSIADGACVVTTGLVGDPVCTVTMDEETFLAIETNRQNPIFAFVKGRIKVTNVGHMRRYDRAFYRFYDVPGDDEAPAAGAPSEPDAP